MRLFDIFKTKKPMPTKSINNINVSATVNPPKPHTHTNLDDQVIPVEQRIKNAIKSKQGLYPHELLVLDYAPTFYTSNNSFQGFWWYKYGIKDVQSILESLEKRGFIMVGDMRDVLSNQSGTVIKELLKVHGKKLTGKKDELVHRALDTIPKEELKKRFPRCTFCLTESGMEAVIDGAYISYIHRNIIEDLDIWSLNIMVHTKPYLPYRDKIWGYLNQRSMKHFSIGNIGLYRNTRFTMSQFLKQEDRIKDSLAMLAEVVFYDLCGAPNNYSPDYHNVRTDNTFNYEKSSKKTAPGIISAIVACQKKLKYTDDELITALMERMIELSTPFQIFSAEDCAKIVLYERDEDIEALKVIYANAKKRTINSYDKDE